MRKSMSVYAQLQQDWKTAFKAKELVKKDILNFVIAQIKQKQIDAKKELSDDEVMKVIKKEIKSRYESVALYTKSGNEKEVQLAQQRIAILETYLPAMLWEEQLRTILAEKIASSGIATDDVSKKRGMLIWPIMKEYGACVDWALLNTIISSWS